MRENQILHAAGVACVFYCTLGAMSFAIATVVQLVCTHWGDAAWLGGFALFCALMAYAHARLTDN